MGSPSCPVTQRQPAAQRPQDRVLKWFHLFPCKHLGSFFSDCFEDISVKLKEVAPSLFLFKPQRLRTAATITPLKKNSRLFESIRNVFTDSLSPTRRIYVIRAKRTQSVSALNSSSHPSRDQKSFFLCVRSPCCWRSRKAEHNEAGENGAELVTPALPFCFQVPVVPSAYLRPVNSTQPSSRGRPWLEQKA